MPGTVHPIEAPRGDPAKSEVRVFEALRGTLPDGWTAWHSLRVRDRENVVRECDFVVASPEFGLLALEVKGGRVRVEGGDWWQDDRRLARSPLQQAHDSLYALDYCLARRGGPRPPFGAVVVLPDVDFSDGPSSGDAAGVVIGRRELSFLDEALRAAARRAVPRRLVPDLARWVPAVHALWGESWVPALSTRDTADVANRRVLRLNADQLQILDIACDTPRAIVTGAAGTGKTLLARELCLRRQRRGQRALYLCFTKALAGALRRDFPEAPADGPPVRAANVRQVAIECLRQAGRTIDMARPGAWEEVGLEGAQAAEHLGLEPYDVVVVDEAFDLSPADWLLVDVLSRGRDLWAFADPRQHFWRERSLPDDLFRGAAPFRLPAQHRNPPAIERFAARWAAEESGAAAPAATPPAAPPADEGNVRVVVAPADDLRAAAAAEVRRWRHEKVLPQDIAVVTLAGQEKSGIAGRADLGGEPTALAESEDAATRVVADTFLRFKGFERPFVVVTELGGADARSEYDTRMYIALTRATAEAVVVCTAAEAAQDARLRR